MPYTLSNPFTTGQLNDLVKNALVVWQKGAEMSQAKVEGVRSLFDEIYATQKTMEFSNFSESGFSSKTGEGEDYMLTSDTQGDTLNLTQIKRTARKKLTEDLLEFNKYPEVKSDLTSIGGKLWRGYALDLTHRFTFAFDTSYTDRDGETVSTLGGDGAALCADTHTMNDGSTYDNKISARLSEAALEAAEDLGNAFVDHNGQLVAPTFDTLITSSHPETAHMARRLVGQPMQTDTDFNNISVYQGKYRHVELPYLDTAANGSKNTAKSRFWFIMDSSMKRNLKVAVRAWPNPEMPTRDPDNNNIQFKAKMWYDIGHLDGNFIVGSNAV